MKKNTVRVYDTILKKIVEVELSDELYTNFKRTKWAKKSIVLAEQIRTIDRNRLLRYVGSVGLEIMEKVDKAVKISIGVKVNC